MASASRREIYSTEAVLPAISGDFDVDEDTLGMNEDEEFELDRQLGYYSDESRWAIV